MKPKQDTKVEADKLVRDIKRATRRKFSAEEKIRIVLAGLKKSGKSLVESFVSNSSPLFHPLLFFWERHLLFRAGGVI